MIKFNIFLESLYQHINEDATYVYSTSKDYEKFKKTFIENIKVAIAHQGETPLHTWCNDGTLIPEDIVDQLMKDDEVYYLIQKKFLSLPYVGGVTNFTVFNNLKPHDQYIFKNTRAHTLKSQGVIRFNDDLEFTVVDDFLCKTDPQFARDCGKEVYEKYKLDHIKNILNKDEEDDISNW